MMNLLRGLRTLQHNVSSICPTQNVAKSFLFAQKQIQFNGYMPLTICSRYLTSVLNQNGHMLDPNQLSNRPLYQTQQLRYKRFPTVKRRRTNPLRWWPKVKAIKEYKSQLSIENREALKTILESKKSNSSPLRSEYQNLNTNWTPESKRTGVIARKLGVIPFWLKTGKKISMTILQVVDNHVINCYNVEETRNKIIHQDRWKTDGFATITVGADSTDPTMFTSQYNRLFKHAGVLPKRKLAKFVITEDAMLPPGTPLNVNHFQIGQYVDVYGKTIDYGFQGVVKRWGFKGDSSKNRGVTKAHRRGGSIAQGRKSGGPFKGRRMAGHMGSERRTMNGLQVLRINKQSNLLFVRGQSVPGPIGSWVYVFDTKILDKRFSSDNPPPFPTYFEDVNAPIPDDLHHPSLHKMDEPTLIFEETEEEKRAQQRRSGAKLAKIRRK